MSLKQPWLRGERNSLIMTQGPDFMSGLLFPGSELTV